MASYLLTSGTKYTEIDTLASALALKEFLESRGNTVSLLLSQNLNESITPSIRSRINVDYFNNPDVVGKEVIVLDVSDPDQFFNSISNKDIVQIYDHHFGFEKYWALRLGSNAHIESIGACSTLIYEKIYKNGNLFTTSPLSIDLLYTAIISNTLNLKAQITRERDISAVHELRKISKLPSNWVEKYYNELDTYKIHNIEKAIDNDTKVQKIMDIVFVICQMELWDSASVLGLYKEEIRNSMGKYQNPFWFFTSPSIKDGVNYIYCESTLVKNFLQKAISSTFDNDNIGITNKLWLRKEIIPKLNELLNIENIRPPSTEV